MKKNICIGLMGLGTVGTGVLKILEENKSLFQDKYGVIIEVKKILVRDIEKKRNVPVEREKLTTSAGDILNDADIDIVIELMGGESPAKDIILEALDWKKTVITANKDVIATAGGELFRKAEERGVDIFFEASVLGGIPVINALKKSFTPGSIKEFKGIVNGTTNYILTKMTHDNMEFEKALELAQRLGFAERDPFKDIEAIDGAYKTAIVSSIAFGVTVKPEQVFRKGISGITYADIECAKILGYCIKLLAFGKELDCNTLQVMVVPALIPLQNPLASVNNEFNSILLRGTYFGDMMFYGLGAGELPTASAVIGDLMKAVKNILDNTRGRTTCTCIYQKEILSFEEIFSRFYVRLTVSDELGSLSVLTSCFASAEVNISDISQKYRTDKEVELILLTHKVKYKDILKAVELAANCGAVTKISNVIFMEEAIN